MREKLIYSALGVIGGSVSMLFGGWTASMTTLLIFMAIDYITGLLVAGVFKSSPKTVTGGLESKAGWKGLVRKGVTLMIVMVACQIDILLATTFVRDAVVIAFVCNEAISIIENAGLMGVPIPNALIRAIDILKQKADEVDVNEDNATE